MRTLQNFVNGKKVSATSDKVKGEITKIDFYGHDAMVEISVANELVQVRIPGPLSFIAGEKVSLEHVGPIRFFAQSDSGPAQ